jgi:hypothetical protein
MRRLGLALLVACGGAPPKSVEIPLPQTGAQAAYEIHLRRPSRVGDRTHVVLAGEEDKITTTRRGGQLVSEDHDKKRARLDAIGTILELDEKSEGARVGYDVGDFTFARGGREVVHMRKGHVEVVRAPKEDDATITVDGEPATDDVREAIKVLMSLRRGGPTDDDIFGTKVPQHVGGHWRIDEKRALEDLAADQASMVSNASLSGDAWLENVTRERGVDCLDVHVKMQVDNLDFSNKIPNANADVARASATYSALFPIDTSVTRLGDRMLIEMTVKLRVPAPAGEISF